MFGSGFGYGYDWVWIVNVDKIGEVTILILFRVGLQYGVGLALIVVFVLFFGGVFVL